MTVDTSVDASLDASVYTSLDMSLDAPVDSETFSDVSSPQIVYWQEGIYVSYADASFCVESATHFSHNEPDVSGDVADDVADDVTADAMTPDLEGAVITVRCAKKTFAMLGFVVDQIDSLIDEWYPGEETAFFTSKIKQLTNFNVNTVNTEICQCLNLIQIFEASPGPIHSTRVRLYVLRRAGLDVIVDYSRPPTQRLVPCPECERRSTRPDDFSAVHLFTVQDCAGAALQHRVLRCPRCHAGAAPRSLVPDLLLADLAPRYHVDPSELVFGTDALGHGGEGSVYRGWLRGRVVAVKQHHMYKGVWAGGGGGGGGRHSRESGVGEEEGEEGAAREEGGQSNRSSGVFPEDDRLCRFTQDMVRDRDRRRT